MIMGECPHCNSSTWTPIGPAPCYSEEKCESCGKTYWLLHSRIDPVAYAEKPKSVGEMIEKPVAQGKGGGE